jgi:hypothetical protein
MNKDEEIEMLRNKLNDAINELKFYAEAWNWKRAGEDAEGEWHKIVNGGCRARLCLSRLVDE